MIKIFVLGFSYKTYDTTLLKLFSEYGAVHSVYIASDEKTGKKLNFGFIEMTNKEEAANAITALNGSELHNRRITVRLADKKEKSAKAAPKPAGNSAIEVKVTTSPSGETIIKKKRPRISK